MQTPKYFLPNEFQQEPDPKPPKYIVVEIYQRGADGAYRQMGGNNAYVYLDAAQDRASFLNRK